VGASILKKPTTSVCTIEVRYLKMGMLCRKAGELNCGAIIVQDREENVEPRVGQLKWELEAQSRPPT
jgi:hypothetical protein